MYRRFGKRLLDVLIAGGALIVLAPLMTPLAVLIRWKLGSPVFFRHERPGLHGKLFNVLKFRTMNFARDEKGELLPGGQRLTGLGRILRGTSLDELPELINVLKGEMSLVGPRPWPPRYLKWYTKEEMRRHNVRPGLTGYAQAYGRSYLEWDKRLALDLEYVDKMSLLLDLRIMVRTLIQVVKREGTVQEDQVRVVPLDEWRAAQAKPNFKDLDRRK